MKVLNLYAGLLGNRDKWENVQVTNVEVEDDLIAIGKQRKPGDEFIKADAHQYLLDHAHEYEFVWSSPPCQTHSKMMKATRHKRNRYTDMSLYQEILFLGHFYKGLWVVENVAPYYEPLIKEDAKIGRHLMWSNFKIRPVDFEDADINRGNIKEWQLLHGFSLEGRKINHRKDQILRNCVNPELGLYILEQAQGIMRAEKTNQLKLL